MKTPATQPQTSRPTPNRNANERIAKKMDPRDVARIAKEAAEDARAALDGENRFRE